ncbi:MAG: bifunctional riboflavin kinase/FAD synthetase [Actinomycetota bacterium]|nr:bifunctional riboflavin kinase/FAD synthetase [Actinomycetota bacterium]
MQRWRGLEAIPNGWGRCVATIGVFDGVHLGHQQIIGRARQLADERGLPAVLVTFTPHPSEVVRPGTHPALLTSNTRKAELAEALGVDVVVFLPFTLEFSRLRPERFVHEAVVADLHASAVVVGDNFRFGHKAEGDIATLAELGRRWGFDAEGVALLNNGAHPISSTYIRSCVQAGDLAAATAVLGRPHRLDGVVVRGDQRGRDLGFPTANLRAEPFAAVPADGVYAGRVVRIDEWGNTRADEPARVAAISVGTNPTFEGLHQSVEAYILDFDGDLYGQNLGIEFVHRLRGMERFDSIGELVVQMAADVQRTGELLNSQKQP